MAYRWGFAAVFGNINVIIGIVALIGVVVFVRVAFTIHSNKKWNIIFLKLSSFSFIIYATHEFTLSMLNSIWGHFISKLAILGLIHWLLIPSIVITLCLALGTIMQKFMPKGYAFVTGGR